ncbi:uncharacterized protein LOC127776696 isoform X2 [Oryza glaberrima]|uniref:uncharacterized protein LOC127776696 isoform X2 n=1 Tax=Oryza glaberrima TaxID=4538 RepID=UPI00224C4CF1|nr:uncharacterized protein LOC127776696 isoform X2 [Oryza glaberrima]
MRDVGTPADRDHSSSGSASTSAQAKKPASTNAEEPSSPTRGGQQQDSRRLRTLSDPELDLAMVCTENASLAVLGHDYDLPTLRALGIVLLETLKERLKETSIDPSVFDRLALLSDSDAYFPSIASDSESEGVRSKTPMGANGKRKQTQAGWLSEEGRKKRTPASQR